MLDWEEWGVTVVVFVAALIAAAVLIIVPRLVLALIGRRVPWIKDLSRRIRRSWMVLVLLALAWLACAASAPGELGWWPELNHVFLIATILACAWFLAALVSFGFERMLIVEDASLPGAEGRRRRTQIIVVHRLVLALIAVVAVGAALFTFPGLRVVGTSLLASAGIVSVIAGLAAQSIFGNLIAGLQIAFTDLIRVGDVVVVQGEWGRIGEINLSYVVVYIWDERRLIVPCSHFTTNPVETWTRQSDNILGTVYMDLDWRVPMDAVRARFAEILEASDTWDRRTSSVYVTGSQGGFVTVRFVMSAKDSGDQWMLRCAVREQMMTWLQREHPEALPQTRVLVAGPERES